VPAAPPRKSRHPWPDRRQWVVENLNVVTSSPAGTSPFLGWRNSKSPNILLPRHARKARALNGIGEQFAGRRSRSHTACSPPNRCARCHKPHTCHRPRDTTSPRPPFRPRPSGDITRARSAPWTPSAPAGSADSVCPRAACRNSTDRRAGARRWSPPKPAAAGARNLRATRQRIENAARVCQFLAHKLLGFGAARILQPAIVVHDLMTVQVVVTGWILAFGGLSGAGLAAEDPSCAAHPSR